MAEIPAVKTYRSKIENVFITKFGKLSSILQPHMEEFSKKAFSAKLIYGPIVQNENFNNIFDQFKSALDWKKVSKT